MTIKQPPTAPLLSAEEASAYELTPNECRALWAYQMGRIRQELTEWYPPRRIAAMQWFRLGDTEPGGARWVCQALGLSYDAVMQAVEAVYIEPTEPDLNRYRKLYGLRVKMSRRCRKSLRSLDVGEYDAYIEWERKNNGEEVNGIDCSVP